MEQSREAYKEDVLAGRTSLGIELGSTRIKAVLVADGHTPIATGSHNWENKLRDGVWTYDLADVWRGLQDCYAKLAADVQKNVELGRSICGVCCGL